MSHDLPSPGPWYTDLEHERVVVFGADKSAVADCGSYYASPYQAVCEANARLIVAAPELLEALKDVVALARKGMVLNGTDEEFANIRLADAIAAIAKAEGRS